jgi:hypothetical protein
MSEPPLPSPTAGQGDAARGAAEARPVRDTTLEEILERRVPKRVRMAQGLGLLCVAVLAAALIGRSLATALNQARGIAVPPIPTTTPVSLGPVLVLSNVSYGTVTLNGTPLAGPPPVVVTFRRGVNTLTQTAPPLRPLTCELQWPSFGYQNQCAVERELSGLAGPAHVAGRPVTPVAVVSLQFSGDDMPAEVQARTLANINATLHSVTVETTVPAGDYIATGQDALGRITSLRAAAPMRADLVGTAASLDFTSDVFCEDSACLPVPAGGSEMWPVSVGVSTQWQFTPLAGGQTLRSAPYSPASYPRLLLSYDPIRGWSVDQQSTEQLNGYSLPIALQATDCPTGTSYLESRALAAVGFQEPLDTFVQPPLSASIVADHQGAGCTLQLVDTNNAPRGLYVWGFGVLLAADAQAHALLPELPAAPPSEIAVTSA